MTTAFNLGICDQLAPVGRGGANPYCRAFAAAPSGGGRQIISQTGRSAVLKTAPTAYIATAWALPI